MIIGLSAWWNSVICQQMNTTFTSWLKQKCWWLFSKGNISCKVLKFSYRLFFMMNVKTSVACRLKLIIKTWLKRWDMLVPLFAFWNHSMNALVKMDLLNGEGWWQTHNFSERKHELYILQCKVMCKFGTDIYIYFVLKWSGPLLIKW